MVRPLANASRTLVSTNGFAVAKAASGPVIGLMKPILMVLVAVVVPPLRPLLQAVTPRPAACVTAHGPVAAVMARARPAGHGGRAPRRRGVPVPAERHTARAPTA